jgi:hypothetical protein
MSHNIYQDMRISKDECYTTFNESKKLIDYLISNDLIKKDQIIWLPFDNHFSNIYKALKETEYQFVMTNLENAQDFYLYEPLHWDIIITNPPFSNRTNLMKRLISFNKPFIILQAVQLFNNQFAVNQLCNYTNDFKFLLPQSRMNFMTYNNDENVIKSSKNGASFYSFWLCYKTGLINTFNQLKDRGSEKESEIYDAFGNVITDNHYNLFTF